MIEIVKKSNLWWGISGSAMVASIIAMIISYNSINAPIRPGLDFIGGTRLQVEKDCSVAGNCDNPIQTSDVQEILDNLNLSSSTIQILGDNKQVLSIRTKDLDVDERTKLQTSLTEKIGRFDPKATQIDTVGPTVGEELFVSGMLALIVSFFGIIVYLSVRFQFDYAFFAIVALFHDVFITAGVFAVLGLVAQVEIDSLFLVSLLTIIGFSVNDTVVIYDRIRELVDENSGKSINDMVDSAVNQTLARSINTTLTTLLPLVAIFFFGGQTLKYFALALIVGFVLGAYSSIFVASTLLAWWRNRQEGKTVTAS